MTNTRLLAALLSATVMLAGTRSALATATVTTATGGSSISADTFGTGAATALTGPALVESNGTGMPTGSIILTAPSGFAFDTTANSVTVTVTGSGTRAQINTSSSTTGQGTSKTVTPTATTITIWVTAVSTPSSARSIFTWSGIKVRPTSGTPLASGNITYGGTSTGVTAGASMGTLTEVAGAASKLAITSVNGGANPTAGTAFSVVVRSQDAYGNAANVTAATGVILSRNAGSGTLGGALTGTISSGTSSVTLSGVTYTKAESGVVLTATRTSGNTLTTGNSSAFTVNAGALDHFAMTLPGTQTAGTAFSITTITALDANNNTVTSFTGTVALTETGGGAGGTVSPATSSAFVAGVRASQSVTLSKSGTLVTITATGSGKTGVSGTFTVNAGALASYTVSAAAATRGTAFNVTVAAKDANANTVTTDSSTVVTMSASSANVQFTGNPMTLTNGTFDISTLDNYAETVTLTATGNGKTGNASVTINPVSGDYRSRASGNWNAVGTWSTWSGTAWANATAAPTSATTRQISVQSPNAVTVSASVTAQNLVIAVGGTVSISSSQTLTVNNGVVNGIISGYGILAESGTGMRLVLNGANTYRGGTIINSGGTVAISSDGNLGYTTGGITFAGGTLQTTGTNVVTSARAITLGTGGAVFSVGVPLYLSGAISGGTGLTTGGNDLVLNRGSGNNAIGAITVNSGRLFVFTLNSINASTIAVQSGATLDFNVAGGATPANAMTFASGACLANRQGTLNVSTGNASFPRSGTMIFNSDDLNTTAITVTGAYPTLLGNLTIQNGPSGQLTPTVGSVTLNGAISGGYGLTKTYPGTLVLGSANTYTGTTVSAGSLTANATGSLGSGSLSVASGATVTIASGTTDTVAGLSLGGTAQAAGTWGSTASSASNKNSTYFGATATGVLTVLPGAQSAYRISAASGTPLPGVSDALTITLVDASGNAVTGFNGDKMLTFSGLATADDGTHPTVTDKSGIPVPLGTSAAITFVSGVSSSASGAAVLKGYKAQGPVTLNVSDSGGSSTTSTGGAGVSLTIANVNPVAGAQTVTREPNTSLKIPISSLLANDTDANHDLLSFTGVNSASSGQGATLLANATYVFYVPANNNTDTFTYNLSDGHGGTATGTVAVDLAGSIPGAATGSISLAGSVATVKIYGIPGVGYDVQRSTDLSTWTTLTATQLTPATPPIIASAADGSVSFTDTFSGTPPGSAYYRIVAH